MVKKLLIILQLFLSVLIFSLDSADIKISKSLFSIFGDDITISQIDKVLEFDNNNREALIKKAVYFDTDSYSLNLSKSLLEHSQMITLESKYHYISILYRLKLYKELLSFSNKISIETIDNEDILYYVSDSYIRIGEYSKSKDIITSARHQFPNDPRFLELLYIMNQKRSFLSNISNLEDPLSSYIRLYNRVDKQLPKLTLEVLIESEISSLDLINIDSYVGNYSVLKPLFNVIDKSNLSGIFRLDVDSDTFPDTLFKIDEGIIEYKGVDRDRDNIIDYEIYLKSGMPKSVVVDGNILSYDNYPYIDYISIIDNDRYTYDLYKNHTKKGLKDLANNIDLSLVVKKIPKLKLISKSLYKGEVVTKKWIYKNDESIIYYSDLNDNNTFDSCIHIKNNVFIKGLRDLDSDGIFDLSEVYKNGVLIGSAYSPTGRFEDLQFIDVYSGSEEEIRKNVDFNWWKK